MLARGYALVQDDAGQVVTSASALRAGEALSLTFADGEVGAVVAGGSSPPRKRPSKTSSDPGSQESLF